jgi:processive 1,2-diacylglycerol beta-glucosyltransferase
VNPPKRILILYLSIGSGHFSAANALKKSIKRIDVEIKCFCEDLFTPVIRDSILPEFLSLSAALFFPRIYDIAWQSGSMTQGYEWLKSFPILRERITELINHRKPDLIICTHSLPCSILAGMRLENPAIPPIAAVSTDFMVHPYWPVQGVDGFIVASKEASVRLKNRGVNEKKIKTFGIPIDPDAEIAICQRKPSGGKKQPPYQVLILAGGKRLAPYVTTWGKTLSLLTESSKLPPGLVHWNVVCGKPSAFSLLLADTIAGRNDVTLFDYVQNFLELLCQQDFIITKPGGLILAESMALGITAILVNRGSGQEAANSDFILSHGSGLIMENEKDILEFLQNIANDPCVIQKMTDSARAIGYPDAARQSAEWLLEGMPVT